MSGNRPVIIIGGGGHARVLISTLKILQRVIIGILHPDTSLIGQCIAGISVLGNDDGVRAYAPDEVVLINGLGSVSLPEKRKDIYLKFKKFGYSFASVVHPSTIVVDDVKIGEGVQIMAGAILQCGCLIGDNAIINTGAIVDHDCKIGSHVHIAPGSVVSGGVEIGEMVHIGTGAKIIQGINVQSGAVIGAGAVVIRNVSASTKVVGNPAREIKYST